MIPPYKGVRMVVLHDRIALKPIEWKREFLSLCKIGADEKDFQPWEGMNPILVPFVGRMDIWMSVRWEQFQDGSEELIWIHWMTDGTEEEARAAFQCDVDFLKMSKEELLRLEKCFVVPEEDRDYLANRFPEMPPHPMDTEAWDLYQARLKVLAGMQPKTVRLIYEADQAKDPAERAKFEFEAVSAYYAEMAHEYRASDLVKEWQRNNPISADWICEFSRVIQKPRLELNAVDHAIVLNWMRKGYHLLTSQELSEAIFKETGKRLPPGTVKKRRERLGLVTKRKPGPPQNYP